MAAAAFLRQGKKVGAAMYVQCTSFTDGLDCGDRPQLRGPCQGIEQCRPQGAVLLLEAHYKLSALGWKARDSAGNHRAP